jgi:alanine racemase
MGTSSPKPLRWVEVDLDAIAHNVREVRRLIGPETGFTAVVKADAYGHGAASTAKTALRNGADSLAVTYLDEALELRRAGVKAPLLVMGPIFPLEASLAARHRLSVMVDNSLLLTSLQRAGSRRRPLGVHVKVDLGLRRWGLPLSQLPSFLRAVQRSPRVRLEGIFSHPGYMVGKNTSRVEESVNHFLSVVAPFLRTAGARKVDVHVADSAVLLDLPAYKLSRVRVGNLIYGINPTAKPLSLKNPWKVFSRVVRVQALSVGQSVGYGGEFTATVPMTVGTVPVGYAHGLTLEPASRWIQVQGGQNYWGTVSGVKCPFVGRVGMSHCLIDLTAVKNLKAGDVVQLPLRRTASANWPKIYKSARSE